jgi:SanA protein
MTTIKSFAIFIIITFAFTVICNTLVNVNAKGRLYDDVNAVPQNKCGLFLATSPITPQGAHNYFFDNRINATVELFNAGKIEYIIASGGDYTQTQTIGCDEPAAIRDSLISRGIPDDRIILDYEGLRTNNSIAKAKKVYGLNSVTLISQKGHNKRGVYLAKYYDIDAVGYNAAPSHLRWPRLKNNVREFFARSKMILELLFCSDPTFGAPSE